MKLQRNIRHTGMDRGIGVWAGVLVVRFSVGDVWHTIKRWMKATVGIEESAYKTSASSHHTKGSSRRVISQSNSHSASFSKSHLSGQNKSITMTQWPQAPLCPPRPKPGQSPDNASISNSILINICDWCIPNACDSHDNDFASNYTPKVKQLAPEKWWFGKQSFPVTAYFQGLMLNFKWVSSCIHITATCIHISHGHPCWQGFHDDMNSCIFHIYDEQPPPSPATLPNTWGALGNWPVAGKKHQPVHHDQRTKRRKSKNTLCVYDAHGWFPS